MRSILVLYTELAPYFLACLEALVKHHNVQVHLVRWPVNREAPFDLAFADGVTVYERRELDAPALLKLVTDVQPDIAFVSGWVDKGYLAVCKALRRSGKPTVMCSDTAWRGDLRQLAATIGARIWITSVFSHAWVTGEAQAIYMRKLGFDGRNVRKGFYSADVDRFAPLSGQFEVLKAGRYPHRFLCVARYIETKGHQYLCDAFAELCDAGEAGDWQLWIAGTGELHEQVKNSTSGMHSRIKHLGFVQTDAMPELMAQCGVFVLPSTYEPWGVVVHEQACAGLPLLLSDAVGAAERFLVEGENGHRFPAGDKSSLKAVMRKMILSTDAELRARGAVSSKLGAQWNPTEWARTAMSFLP